YAIDSAKGPEMEDDDLSATLFKRKRLGIDPRRHAAQLGCAGRERLQPGNVDRGAAQLQPELALRFREHGLQVALEPGLDRCGTAIQLGQVFAFGRLCSKL